MPGTDYSHKKCELTSRNGETRGRAQAADNEGDAECLGVAGVCATGKGRDGTVTVIYTWNTGAARRGARLFPSSGTASALARFHIFSTHPRNSHEPTAPMRYTFRVHSCGSLSIWDFQIACWEITKLLCVSRCACVNSLFVLKIK